MESLQQTFSIAARHARVRGFAVGRTVFGDALKGWLTGELDDRAAVAEMAVRYRRLVQAWDAARKGVCS